MVYNDATERKRAEIAVRESEERQAFLLRFSDTLRGEPDPAAIGDQAVHLIAEKLDVDRFYLVSLNADDDEVIITHEATRADLPQMRGVYRGTTFPSAFGELLKRTIVYDDV